MYRMNGIAGQEALTAPVGEAAVGLAQRALAAGLGFLRAVSNRRSVRGMAQFDDRMLADIGLSRSDVASALAQPVWVDPSRDLAETVANRRNGRLWGRPLRRS